MSLTPRQARFVEEYLKDLNGTQAAIRAGYAEKGASVEASRLLGNAKVESAISEAQAERSRRTGITQDRVLQELARIGFADIRDLFSWGPESVHFVPSADLTGDQAAAIASVKSKTRRFTTDDGLTETTIELEMKMCDKLSALQKIGKHLGMFADRSVDIDTSGLSESELERIANGEDPVRVLADSRKGGN